MKKGNRGLICSFVALGTFLGGCIHEYPYASKDKPGTPEPGVTPGNIYVSLEINFEDGWENIIHEIPVATKDGRDRSHRIVVEVKEGSGNVCRDIRYLSDEEFSSGGFTHNLSIPLRNSSYDVAVWHDQQDEEGEYPYDATSLGNVKHLVYSTVNVESMHCSYAREILELREHTATETEDNKVTKTIKLELPTARFEIIATDVQEFIALQKEALLQGDSFTAYVSLKDGAFDNFNIFTGTTWKEKESMELSGRMRLPFAEYDELKIAEGSFFCTSDGEVVATLAVVNSALSTVVQTDYFSFPVKRGYLTIVKGDILTNSLDGLFSVNHVWDGEIDFDAEEFDQ